MIGSTKMSIYSFFQISARGESSAAVAQLVTDTFMNQTGVQPHQVTAEPFDHPARFRPQREGVRHFLYTGPPSENPLRMTLRELSFDGLYDGSRARVTCEVSGDQILLADSEIEFAVVAVPPNHTYWHGTIVIQQDEAGAEESVDFDAQQKHLLFNLDPGVLPESNDAVAKVNRPLILPLRNCEHGLPAAVQFRDVYSVRVAVQIKSEFAVVFCASAGTCRLRLGKDGLVATVVPGSGFLVPRDTTVYPTVGTILHVATYDSRPRAQPPRILAVRRRAVQEPPRIMSTVPRRWPTPERYLCKLTDQVQVARDRIDVSHDASYPFLPRGHLLRADVEVDTSSARAIGIYGVCDTRVMLLANAKYVELALEGGSYVPTDTTGQYEITVPRNSILLLDPRLPHHILSSSNQLVVHCIYYFL